MKKQICILLILSTLLCGCSTVESSEETTLPPTTQADTLPSETIQPEPTEPVWTGFSGSLDGYVFLHEGKRDQYWEEEILTIAQVYLEEHPWLVDDTTRTSEVESYISTPNWEWKSQYIPEKREAFLAGINELIPRIPEYEDGVLTWEVQRIFAEIGECHANIYPQMTNLFPLSFFPFQEDGELVIRVVTAPANKEHLLYTRLTAINGIPVEEVLARMRPYSSCDADTGFVNKATIQIHSPAYLSQAYLLQATGVMNPDDKNAEFTFLTETGEYVTETMTAYGRVFFYTMNITDHSLPSQLPYSFTMYSENPYWIEHFPGKQALYIRITQFAAEDEETFLKVNREISALLNSVDTMEKVILDLRQNPGGAPPRAYAGLLNFLRHPKVQQTYVLIDSGSFSMSVIACYNIRTEIPNAIFVGTPTGQGLPTGSVREYVETPHGLLETRIPGGMSLTVSGDTFLYFEPDVEVHQTLEDYKNGIDTVLTYVLQQK